ncbi:MAG: signal recognition particle-docking protein FtsY [Bacillota bacterium]
MSEGLWAQMKAGLKRTRDRIAEGLESFIDFSVVDEAMFEDLEAVLVGADVGVGPSERLLSRLRKVIKRDNLRGKDEVLRALSDVILEQMEGASPGDRELDLTGDPTVMLLVGVNGVGKTTSAAKLAWRLKGEGHRPIMGAADTFRAAGIEQLELWGRRVGVDVIRHAPGADPAAVGFDTINAARSRGCDVVLIDTAGRLHTRKNLMHELEKMCRVVSREVPDAPHESLLVVDATTGQNALRQVELFGEAVPLTGVVLTKLDGTARGGITIAIEDQTGIRVKFVGLGEGVEDLQPFRPEEFVAALLG